MSCSTHKYSHIYTIRHTATHCNTLQHTATHCNTLQHTATHCNTLQHTATHLYCTTTHIALQHKDCIHVHEELFSHWYARHMTLQHTATHCNTLQNTATHCNTHCNTLQHTLQHRDCVHGHRRGFLWVVCTKYCPRGSRGLFSGNSCSSCGRGGGAMSGVLSRCYSAMSTNITVCAHV